MVGETHREGFILTARRTWHATCGTRSDWLLAWESWRGTCKLRFALVDQGLRLRHACQKMIELSELRGHCLQFSMSTLPGISCCSPSVCGWAAQTQTLGASARRIEQRRGWKLRLEHGGYSSGIAERLCDLWIIASMGRHNKPWRRLGGWGDPP